MLTTKAALKNSPGPQGTAGSGQPASIGLTTWEVAFLVANILAKITCIAASSFLGVNRCEIGIYRSGFSLSGFCEHPPSF